MGLLILCNSHASMAHPVNIYRKNTVAFRGYAVTS